ncbi:MAG: glycosyltransferase [Butyrivibrio sp.]|nr:glycosyltransferase [Butyrivibrio sp.]
MNIAILIPSLGGGGAERVAQKLGNHYVDEGDKVYYFLLNDHGRAEYDVKGKVVNTGVIPPSSIRSGGMRGFLFRMFQASAHIRRLKRKYQIDAAISFMEECNYLNIFSQRGERVIVRICTILSMRDDMNHFLYNSKVIRFFYSLPCRIVVMSRFARKEMNKVYFVSKRKIHIIPNPVEPVNYDYFRKAGYADYGKNCIISVGRLDPVKQQDRIIRAFSVTLKTVPNAKLVLVGRGDNERYLRSVAAEVGVADCVELAGFCKDVWDKFGHAGCYVMASKVEGFPNGMVEAMSHGIPVVSTDSPGGIEDILGREIKIADDYTICKYGIKTKKMPMGKAQKGEAITEEERRLGMAMAKMLTNEDLRLHYSKKSQERMIKYRPENVFIHWDRLIGKK